MDEKLISKLQDYLLSNPTERFEICQDIDSYNGCMDFTRAVSLDEAVEGLSSSDVARRMFYGNVKSLDDLIRFDGYDNFESVTRSELIEESADYIDEIIQFVDSYGTNCINNPDFEQIVSDYEEGIERD